MRIWVLPFAASALLAADSQQLALVLKAQLDFDKVALAAVPPLVDSGACVQSQAAVMAVSAASETAQLYYRRGFCRLAEAALMGGPDEYQAAARDFDRAIAAWPARLGPGKQPLREPAPAALRVLPWVARLHAVSDDAARAEARMGIEAALAAPGCGSGMVAQIQCENILEAAREWLGWMALGDRRLDDAARWFGGAAGTGWPEWVEGQRRFRQGDYAGAAAEEDRAVTVWKASWRDGGPALSRRLGPAPEVNAALVDLGAARLLAGDEKGAIADLTAALKADPANARSLFLRARAHDLTGEREAALADYGLASRTAFAAAHNGASGEAHLYRGILLYRRGDPARAESEFASALDLEIPGALRGDARAWRHLAAVAAGTCGSERDLLEGAMALASPYFPRAEARALASACAH
jgi:tetratricopeptide (TPR) repeat protein